MSRKNTVSDLRGPSNVPRSKDLNDISNYEWKWINFIESLALSRFKWDGLPESIDERFLELSLLRNGQAIYFELEGVPFATRVMTHGNPNVYDNYTEYTSIGGADWNVELESDSGIVIWDSMTRANKYFILLLQAAELAEIDIQARVNRRQQRSVTVFSGPEGSQQDMARLTRDLEMNESSRIALKGWSENVEIKAIQTGIKYLQEEFHADRTATLSQVYASLGIENVGFQKAERLLKVEAGIGTDSVARIREDALFPRQQAAEQINAKFGTNITVEWRSDAYGDLNGEESESEETEENEDA